MKEDLLKIINNYGVIPQLKHFNSEVFELTEAIINYVDFEDFDPVESLESPDYKEYLKEHIEEEFADLMVMLEQFKAYYNLDNDKIIEIMKFKIDRQLERMKEEK